MHQSIMYGGIPFELKVSNKETLEAMDDAANHRNLSGPYNSFAEMMEDLDS